MRYRNWLIWTALGGIIALTGAACSGDGTSSTAGSPSTTSISVPTTVYKGFVAPDGGTVQVIEQGVSQIEGYPGEPIVSYGVVVANSSKNWVALTTYLTVTFTNDSGESIEDIIEKDGQNVVMTFPGKLNGLGGQTYVSAFGATQIQVRVDSVAWVHVDSDWWGLAEITTSDVLTTRNSDDEYRTTFTFEVTSGFEREFVGPTIFILFRDGNRQLIGGAEGYYPRHCGKLLPGTSECTTMNFPEGTLPAGTVDSLTQVYVRPMIMT